MCVPVKEYPNSDAKFYMVPKDPVLGSPDATISRYATEYSEFSNEMREIPYLSSIEKGASTAVAFNRLLPDVKKHGVHRVVHDAFCYPRYPILGIT